LLIQVGDFNCHPQSIEHTLLTQHGLVFDAWDVFHPGPAPDIASLSDQAQIDVLGVTCESKLNVFRPKNLEKDTNDGNAKRIDYIFTTETLVETIQVVLTERITSYDINYSDHYGVSATVHLPIGYRKTTGYLPPQLFDEIHKIYIQYREREDSHSIRRIWHFFLSTAIIVILLTMVWFAQRKPVIFVLMFVSTMSSWCGCLDGIIGFVFGKWERRTLKEFASELELARQLYGQEGVPVGQSSSLGES
jgi:sphingomyelin phosphodiesterase 2